MTRTLKLLAVDRLLFRTLGGHDFLCFPTAGSRSAWGDLRIVEFL